MSERLNQWVHIGVTKEQLKRVKELKNQLDEPTFNKVFMVWVNKILTEIQLKDLEGIMYVITD